jgi:hypothetical protein
MLGGRKFNKLRGQTATRGARSVEDHSLILLKCSTYGDQTINHAAPPRTLPERHLHVALADGALNVFIIKFIK